MEALRSAMRCRPDSSGRGPRGQGSSGFATQQPGQSLCGTAGNVWLGLLVLSLNKDLNLLLYRPGWSDQDHMMQHCSIMVLILRNGSRLYYGSEI